MCLVSQNREWPQATMAGALIFHGDWALASVFLEVWQELEGRLGPLLGF
jgi:hypothetical protein